MPFAAIQGDRSCGPCGRAVTKRGGSPPFYQRSGLAWAPPQPPIGGSGPTNPGNLSRTCEVGSPNSWRSWSARVNICKISRHAELRPGTGSASVLQLAPLSQPANGWRRSSYQPASTRGVIALAFIVQFINRFRPHPEHGWLGCFAAVLPLVEPASAGRQKIPCRELLGTDPPEHLREHGG